MSDIAKAIKKEYSDITPKKIHVEAWGRDVYVFPITIGQLTEINRETDDTRRAAKIVAVRARTEDNRRILDDEDFEAICSHGVGTYGPEIIGPLAAELMVSADIEGDSGN